MDRSSRGQVDPFIVMDVVEAARQAEEAGRHIIHMEVGQPGTPAPAGARAALGRELEASSLGYTVSLGIRALRAGIAGLYKRWHGVVLNPDRVVVTAGSSGAFYVGADVGDLTGDSVASAAELLREAGVATTPGLDFDPVRGRRTLRFSAARATAGIVERLRRLEGYMRVRVAGAGASGGDI